jgi:hypothetical protein
LPDLSEHKLETRQFGFSRRHWAARLTGFIRRSEEAAATWRQFAPGADASGGRGRPLGVLGCWEPAWLGGFGRQRPPEGGGGVELEGRAQQVEASGAGEPVLLDGVLNRRRYCGVFGVGERRPRSFYPTEDASAQSGQITQQSPFGSKI